MGPAQWQFRWPVSLLKPKPLTYVDIVYILLREFIIIGAYTNAWRSMNAEERHALP